MRRAFGVKGAVLLNQDGYHVHDRQKCCQDGFEDASRSTMLISIGMTRDHFFCPKCRKSREVQIQAAMQLDEDHENGGSTMLVLTRKSQETVVIGGSAAFPVILKLTVVKIQGGQVRLGIEGPASVPVHRLEVWEQIHAGREQQPAKLTAEQAGILRVRARDLRDTLGSDIEDSLTRRRSHIANYLDSLLQAAGPGEQRQASGVRQSSLVELRRLLGHCPTLQSLDDDMAVSLPPDAGLRSFIQHDLEGGSGG